MNINIVKKEDLGVVSKEKPKLKGVKYRVWTTNNIPPAAGKHKRLTDKEMTEVSIVKFCVSISISKLLYSPCKSNMTGLASRG